MAVLTSFQIEDLCHKGWTSLSYQLKSTTQAECHSEISRLFDLSDETKRKYIYKEAWGRTGYLPPKSEKLADGYSYEDKEVWQLCKEPHMSVDHKDRFINNYWPAKDMAAKQIFMALYSECELLCQSIAEQLTALFPNINEHNSLFSDTASYLRLIKYRGTEKVMCAPHYDRDILTMVVYQSSPGLTYYDRANCMHSCGQLDIILSVGEIFSKMTDGRLFCSKHEVINSKSNQHDRHSIVFFFIPRSELFFPVMNKGRMQQSLNVGCYLQERMARML